MDKTEKIWLNGKLVNWEDAKVHVLHVERPGVADLFPLLEREKPIPLGVASLPLQNDAARIAKQTTKRIVENYHAGKIFVKSSVLNKGTTFRIILKK